MFKTINKTLCIMLLGIFGLNDSLWAVGDEDITSLLLQDLDDTTLNAFIDFVAEADNGSEPEENYETEDTHHEPAPTCLHNAVLDQDLSAAEQFLNTNQGRAHIDMPKKVQGKSQEAPLHIAAIHGNVPMIELLLSYDATINIRQPRTGKLPLHLAIAHNHAQAVQYLLSQGADARRTDISGKTPLYLAALSGNPDIVKVLLNHKDCSEDIGVRGKNLRNKSLLAPWEIALLQALNNKSNDLKIEVFRRIFNHGAFQTICKKLKMEMHTQRSCNPLDLLRLLIMHACNDDNVPYETGLNKNQQTYLLGYLNAIINDPETQKEVEGFLGKQEDAINKAPLIDLLTNRTNEAFGTHYYDAEVLIENLIQCLQIIFDLMGWDGEQPEDHEEEPPLKRQRIEAPTVVDLTNEEEATPSSQAPQAFFSENQEIYEIFQGTEISYGGDDRAEEVPFLPFLDTLRNDEEAVNSQPESLIEIPREDARNGESPHAWFFDALGDRSF
tara:strand:+ start:327 stop:1820 length:1494 start_codon:yes stop_codon:yes gene_type:complete